MKNFFLFLIFSIASFTVNAEALKHKIFTKDSEKIESYMQSRIEKHELQNAIERGEENPTVESLDISFHDLECIQETMYIGAAHKDGLSFLVCEMNYMQDVWNGQAQVVFVLSEDNRLIANIQEIFEGSF